MLHTSAADTAVTNPALVRACAAVPDDDLPRLVYADWLDENGAPNRADFIRTSVQANRYREAEKDPTRNKPVMVNANVYRLEGLHLAVARAQEWGLYEPLLGKKPSRMSKQRGKDYNCPILRWDRGLVSTVDSARLWGWVRWGVLLCQRQPVRSVVITGRTALSVGRGRGEFLWMSKPGSNLLRLSNGVETKPEDFYEFDPAHMLPPGIFSYLSGGHVASNEQWAQNGVVVRVYPSGKEADKDLNRAALVWAKAEGRMAG